MIKEVPCMECDGKGFIAKFGEYSVWSERCPNCGGTGTVKVPMTNADRIRVMSDEELAKFLSDFKDCVGDCLVGRGVKDCSGICATRETLKMWLKQPAEEDT